MTTTNPLEGLGKLMMKHSIAAPEINRRRFLLNTAAVGAVGSVAATAAVPAAATAAEPKANPELLSLFRALKDAVAEKTAAKDAKEWIVDEWRHMWPLAPDEITLPGIEWVINDEVDLSGRPLVRPGEKRARRLYDLEALASFVESMAAWVGKARTDKTRADRLARVAQNKHNLHLGEAYYSEIERIKNASGIRAADARIKAADQEISRLSAETMALPASSLACLAVKAETAEIWGQNAGIDTRADLGPLGWAWRFSHDILSMTKGASA